MTKIGAIFRWGSNSSPELLWFCLYPSGAKNLVIAFEVKNVLSLEESFSAGEPKKVWVGFVTGPKPLSFFCSTATIAPFDRASSRKFNDWN